MITITRRLEWDAAHRVLRHESKCASLHGHRYAAEITAAATDLDAVGRVVDFGVVKELVGRWIDENLDHTTIVNREDEALLAFVAAQGKRPAYVIDGEPTAENIARELYRISSELLSNARLWVVRVRVYETPNCWADARVGGDARVG